ncbi:MAG: LuxR C-terminal-related transcriptional regulator [Jiangellaceae bacterium]
MVTASAEGEHATVLTPKLQVPLLPVSAVQRSRLLTAMAADEANGVRVTVVSAPAGSGKTLLLAERSALLQAAGHAVAWVSLAEEDNDPHVLWSSILAALAEAVGTMDSSTGSALGALSPPIRGTESSFLTAFLDVMHSCQVPVWLVLDDAHELVGRPALDGLRTILRSMPAELRLMLGCRHDLSLPLARLAVAGRAREIRFAEIAFDRAEVDQLLASHDIDLHDDDVETLLARTEGWAAGLRLATLSMIRHDDAAKFVAGFAGDSRPVADYLVSEILSQQVSGVLDFLLATAGPDRLSVDLARRLSGRDDAGIVLDSLERANALVMRLGQGSSWYRYHTLLRSYLHAELDRRDVEAQRRLNVTAADWFVEHDLPRSALEHAAAAADWDRVVQIVDRYGLRLLLSGEAGALYRVLTLLPRNVAARPVVALTAALTALEAGDLPAATRQLDRLGRESLGYRDPRLQVLGATALLYEARLRGDQEAPLATLIESASVVAAVQDPDLELLSVANRGAARLWLGEYAEAEADLSAALRLARRNSRDFVALDCLSRLSATAAAQNDFVAAADRVRDAIAFAKERGWASSTRMASAYLVAAWAAWQMLDRPAATRYATLAAAVIEADVEPEVDVATRCLGAFVDFERGVGRRGALQRLRRDWLRLDGKRLTPALIGFLCGTEQNLALSIGETAWAADVAARAERYLGDVGDTQVLRAIMAAHHGRNAAARKALAPVLNREQPCHAVTSEIAAWLMAAYYADRAGEASRAHEAVMAALDLAAPRRALRTLVYGPVQVRDLLIRNVGRFGAFEGFVAEVLSAGAETGPALHSASVEALTSRELIVLRDLPSLLSVEQMAEAHVVSANTVKTHLKAIYRKLGVSSRREAVDRARELGLL